MQVLRWRLVDCIGQLNLAQLFPVTHNYYLPFTEEVVVGFTVAAVIGFSLSCAVGSAVDVNDAVPDDPGMVVVEDAWTPIDVPLCDPTVIVGRGDTTEVITVENPSVVVIALDTSTANVMVTLTVMLEDCTTELSPKKKNVRLKKTTLLALK